MSLPRGHNRVQGTVVWQTGHSHPRVVNQSRQADLWGESCVSSILFNCTFSCISYLVIYISTSSMHVRCLCVKRSWPRHCCWSWTSCWAATCRIVSFCRASASFFIWRGRGVLECMPKHDWAEEIPHHSAATNSLERSKYGKHSWVQLTWQAMKPAPPTWLSSQASF